MAAARVAGVLDRDGLRALDARGGRREAPSAGRGWPGRRAVPTALEVREADVGVGERAAVLLLAVVLDLAPAGGEDRPVVDLTGAEGARRAAAGVGRAGVERRRRVDAVLDVHQLDARRVLVDEGRGRRAGGIVERVGGPEGVDLVRRRSAGRCARSGCPTRLQHAVVDVLGVELARVVVDVDRADAVLDGVLAEAVEGLRAAEHVVVGVEWPVGLAVARADVVEAEDLGGGDARGPAGLVQAAVPARGVQVVLVEQRAVLLPAVRTLDVLVGRQAGVTEQLDAVDALAAKEPNSASRRFQRHSAAVGGSRRCRRPAFGCEVRHCVPSAAGLTSARGSGSPPSAAAGADVAAVVEELHARLAGRHTVAGFAGTLRLRGAVPGEDRDTGRSHHGTRARAPRDSLHLASSSWEASNRRGQ